MFFKKKNFINKIMNLKNIKIQLNHNKKKF